MLYYPPTLGPPSYLKVFDFSLQKRFKVDDEFISVDSKGTSSTQVKQKVNTLRNNRTRNAHKKQKNQTKIRTLTFDNPNSKSFKQLHLIDLHLKTAH